MFFGYRKLVFDPSFLGSEKITRCSACLIFLQPIELRVEPFLKKICMKKYLLAFAFLFVMVAGFSQGKPTKKEKPPTEKEMEEMKKEMDDAMKDMTPEDKRIMDSMGIKMPSMPTMPKMTD